MGEVTHVLHAVLAGVWLGGVVFTTAVVSPALKAMKWDEVERVSVRAVIGKRYAGVAGVNLALLLVFAVLDGWFAGFGAVFYVEYALLAGLFGLVAVHGAYFGRRLSGLAAAEKATADAATSRGYAEERRALQGRSWWVSQLNLVVSTAVAILAVIG